MQIAFEITESERSAVIRHIKQNKKLSTELINKMLSKYEITLQNKLEEIIQLKMDLDDRDIAFKLFCENKLKKSDLKNLALNGK